MSKANSAVKVLRTALKRVQKSWTKGKWVEKGNDGNYGVCLEGAIFGYCDSPKTQAQKEALQAVVQVIKERTDDRHRSVPSFNDDIETTLDDIIEVIKLGIIRLETGWDPNNPEDNYIDPEEVDSLYVDQAT